MKKLFLPFLIIFMLSSCTPVITESVSPDFSLNLNVTVNYMQNEYTFNAVTDDSGTLTMSILKPENLQGIKIICNAQAITAVCDDVKIECADGYYPFTTFYKVLNFAKNTEPTSEVKGKDENTFEYVSGKEKYTFVTDSTGRIKQINTPTGRYKMG